MNNDDTYKITRQFFTNGCTFLNFEGCEKLFQDYKDSLGGGGCSACKRRKMKNKYSRILADSLKELNYEEVKKTS